MCGNRVAVPSNRLRQGGACVRGWKLLPSSNPTPWAQTVQGQLRTAAMLGGERKDMQDGADGTGIPPATPPRLRLRKLRQMKSERIPRSAASPPSHGSGSRSASPARLSRARSTSPAGETLLGRRPAVFVKEFSHLAHHFSQTFSNTSFGSVSLHDSQSSRAGREFRREWEPCLRNCYYSLAALQAYSKTMSVVTAILIFARFGKLKLIFGAPQALMLLSVQIAHLIANISVLAGILLRKTQPWIHENFEFILQVLLVFPILGANSEFFADEYKRSLPAYQVNLQRMPASIRPKSAVCRPSS